MRTETRTVYIAEDGTEHLTKREARQADLSCYLRHLFELKGIVESIGAVDDIIKVIVQDRGMFISLVPGKKPTDRIKMLEQLGMELDGFEDAA